MLKAKIRCVPQHMLTPTHLKYVQVKLKTLLVKKEKDFRGTTKPSTSYGWQSSIQRWWNLQKRKRKSLRKEFVMAGLKSWFKQNWVDIGKEKGGGFKKCGRKSASGSKKKKVSKMRACTKSSKDDKLTEAECRTRKTSKKQIQLVENQLTFLHLQKRKSHDGWIHGQKNGN